MPRRKYNELVARKLIQEFERRGFEGAYCETKGDGLKAVLGMLPEGCVVSCGGPA
jgi:ActR/RegA family two-component response regulator